MNPAVHTSLPRAGAPPGLAAVAGVAATSVALGLSELLAALLPGATSLVAAIGQAVIDRQPAGAKDLVVALFGTNDKLAFEIVIVVVALLIGAGLGVLARRSFVAAAAGFVAFGLLGFVAAVGRPAVDAPILVGQVGVSIAAGIRVLSWAMGRLSRNAPVGRFDDETTRPDRRSFLVRAGTLGVAGLVAGLTGRWIVERGRVAPAAGVAIPSPSEPVPPLAAGMDLASTIPGLTPLVVPNDSFYRIDTALLVPSVDIATWQLRVHGLVDREVVLSWADLVAMPLIEQYVTIACVSNEVGGDLVGNAKWTGVRLRDVLALAGVRSSASQLVGRSVDGWTAGMPTAWVMDEAREPMIAVQMNGEPLPPRHGYPARLIVPGLYGYVSATKWLRELELTTLSAFDAFWVEAGWAKKAPILTQSRIDTPRGTATAGRIAIAGVAWAPDRGISKVEVAIDGAWLEARLSAPISDATWVQWMTPWEATPGEHTIAVRATDGEGVLQEELTSPPAPDGARGWHTVTVRIG